VLIIEDDPQFRMTLAAYLEDSGYNILEAGDGLGGMEIFGGSRSDIVLTDLRMPGLDGLGVIAAVKKQSPSTPVIAFTGTSEPLAAENTMRIGAFACLFKPIEDLGALEAEVVKALEQI
jgi:DNA-binding NtrC family response regulator